MGADEYLAALKEMFEEFDDFTEERSKLCDTKKVQSFSIIRNVDGPRMKVVNVALIRDGLY